MEKILIFSRVPAHAFIYKDICKKQAFILTDNRFLKEYKNSGYRNVFGFDNYTKNEDVSIKGIELVNLHHIRIVLVSDESDVERAGFLREIFNLEGQKSLSSRVYRDKFWMKQLLKNIISLPEFKSVETKEDVKNFINKNGLPIVLKPRKGWSSLKTYKIVEQSQLDTIENYNGYLIEKWIENSVMYTIDGIQKNGVVLWSSIHQYDCNVLESLDYANRGFAMMTSPKMFDENFKEKSKVYTEAIINTLNINEKFCSPFHLEFFCTTEEEFIFCEIGSRFGGGKTIDLIELEYNIDLPLMFLEETKNKSSNLKWKNNFPKQFVACYKKYFSFDKNFIDKVKTEKYIVSANTVKQKNELMKPKSINDIEELYVIKSTSFEDLLNKIQCLSNETLIKN